MSLGSSKPVPPQRFIPVFCKDAHAELRFIKALQCSQPIKRQRLGAILQNMQYSKRVLAVSAAPP
jgi:hypothetical protein